MLAFGVVINPLMQFWLMWSTRLDQIKTRHIPTLFGENETKIKQKLAKLLVGGITSHSTFIYNFVREDLFELKSFFDLFCRIVLFRISTWRRSVITMDFLDYSDVSMEIRGTMVRMKQINMTLFCSIVTNTVCSIQ